MKILYIILPLLLLTGCRNDLFKTSVGQYSGTTLTKKSGNIKQALASAEIKLKSSKEVEIEVKSVGDNEAIHLNAFAEKDSKVSFLIPIWSDSKIPLKKVSKTCLVSGPSEVISVTLCYNGIDLTIDLTKGATGEIYSLAVSRTIATEHPVFETPQSYTLEQLFKRSIDQNFDSPIQFEKVVQAKLRMESIYLDLIPHISLIGALNIASLNLVSALKAVGDVVPFLFPTRWMEARAAKYQSESEFDAWILTKANAANVVEGLTYSVLRDTLVVLTVEENRKNILQVRDQIRLGESAGLIQAGSSDDIESIINLLDRGNETLRNSLIQEKMALSEAAGFYNFAAIQDVQSQAELPIEHSQPYSDTEITKIADTALDRSYERRQLNALIEASRIGEKERYFQWLDPSGDYHGGLGINLVPYVKIGVSQTQELMAKRHKIEAEIIDRVGRTALTANQALRDYFLANKGLNIQNRIIQRQLGNLQSGVNFSLIDLSSALQEKLRVQIEILKDQYTYYIANSNLNRVLLSGPYANLPTNRGEPLWIIPGGALN